MVFKVAKLYVSSFMFYERMSNSKIKFPNKGKLTQRACCALKHAIIISSCFIALESISAFAGLPK